MKLYRPGESARHQLVNQLEDTSANDDINSAELQEFEFTANEYERRWRNRAKFHKEFQQETIWMVIGLYLILLSLAFVVL